MKIGENQRNIRVTQNLLDPIQNRVPAWFTLQETAYLEALLYSDFILILLIYLLLLFSVAASTFASTSAAAQAAQPKRPSRSGPASASAAASATAAMIRGRRLTTSLMLAAFLLPALISSLDDIDDDGIYSRVQKSIENFVFRPKMAIFRRAGMRKEGLPLPLAFQYLILRI